MRLAIDFDGVCTDLKALGVPRARAAQQRHLLSTHSITASFLRPGIVEMISVFSLFGEIHIVTSRPPVHEPYIHAWLKGMGLGSLVTSIICCWEEPKAEILDRYDLHFLIDDSAKHVSSLAKLGRAILWSDQTWRTILKAVINKLSSRMAVGLRSDPAFILAQITDISQCGASPAFLLTDEKGNCCKLRACCDVETVERITALLRVSEALEYSHVARLRDVSGRAILKSYIPGIPLVDVNEKLRPPILVKIAYALAELHKLTGDISSTCPFEDKCFLICGADNFNTVITPEGEIAFVDLEACMQGWRWIDVAWSEELLCTSEREKESFLDAYLTASQVSLPTAQEWETARSLFLTWLQEQALRSVALHPHDKRRQEILDPVQVSSLLLGKSLTSGEGSSSDRAT